MTRRHWQPQQDRLEPRMTITENTRRAIEQIRPLLTGYDRLRHPTDCWHCNGTMLAPSTDGRTPCGFCDPSVPPEAN